MTTSLVRNIKKLAFQPEYRTYHIFKQKLKNKSRYTPTSVRLLGKKIDLVDAASFLFMYKEIFEQQIYKFKAKDTEPTIIDGGANIGLSILYFKQLYPDSHIVAFEPDSKVFKVLADNVSKCNVSNVELVEKALWSSETVLEFMSEGADGGRVTQTESGFEKYRVSTIRLRDYLKQPVDFLKLDIEGAETEVLKDCEDLLTNVNNLFIEYHSFVSQPQTINVVFNILSKANFRLHIHQVRPTPQPFYYRPVCLEMDMILNIFAFRE